MKLEPKEREAMTERNLDVVGELSEKMREANEARDATLKPIRG